MSTGKNLLKNGKWTFPIVCYFIWKLARERVSLKYFVNGCCTYKNLQCTKDWNSYLLCRLFTHCFLAILCMLFQKNPKTGGRGREGEGIEDMQITGVLKKEHEKIPGVNWKRSGVSRGDQLIKKKSCGISMGLGFWSWNFQARECITILQYFLGWTLFFSGISKRKSDKPKYSKVFFTKMSFSPRRLPLFGFFSGIQ